MIVLLIMLVILMEIVLSVFIIATITKFDKDVIGANSQVQKIKQETIKIISDYRISIKMANLQAKRLKDELKIKKIFEMLNSIAGFLVLLNFGKNKICKKT